MKQKSETPRAKDGAWRTTDPTPAAQAFIACNGDIAKEAYVLLHPGKHGSNLGGGQQAINRVLQAVAAISGDKKYLPGFYFNTSWPGFAA